MKKIVLGLLLSSLATQSVADPVFSAELLLGRAEQETDFDGFLPTSGSDTSLGIRGAYILNPFVAFELAFQDYGETNDTYIDNFGDTINDRISTNAFNIGAKGSFPFANGWSAIGRIGASRWELEIRSTDSFFPGQVFEDDDSGVDLYYGLGVQYDINTNLIVGVEYTVIDAGFSTEDVSGDHQVNNFSASIGYRF